MPPGLQIGQRGVSSAHSSGRGHQKCIFQKSNPDEEQKLGKFASKWLLMFRKIVSPVGDGHALEQFSERLVNEEGHLEVAFETLGGALAASGGGIDGGDDGARLLVGHWHRHQVLVVLRLRLEVGHHEVARVDGLPAGGRLLVGRRAARHDGGPAIHQLAALHLRVGRRRCRTLAVFVGHSVAITAPPYYSAARLLSLAEPLGAMLLSVTTFALVLLLWCSRPRAPRTHAA